MIRTVIAAALVGLLASLLTACGGGDSGTASSVPGVTDTEILIGSHNDLSGPLALIGKQAINATRMRFDEANEAGGIHGRQLRLIVEDSQYQVPRAIQAANKLVNRDGIFAMYLGLGTQQNNAIIPMLEQNGVPNLFPISGARSMIEPFRELQFNGRGIYFDEIQAGTEYFIRQRGAQNPCIIYQDTDFGHEIYEGAQQKLAELGMRPLSVSAHKPTDTEFTPTILRMRNAGCDLVLMGTVIKDTILIFEAARKLGWDSVSWVGTNASYSQAVARQESGASEGYSVFTHIAMIYGDDPNLTPEQADWARRYRELFEEEPEYFAMEAYRNADLVVRALENAGPDLTRDGLIAGMEAITDYTDIFGYQLGFGPNDHKGVETSTLSTVKNGRWVVEEASISY